MWDWYMNSSERKSPTKPDSYCGMYPVSLLGIQSGSDGNQTEERGCAMNWNKKGASWSMWVGPLLLTVMSSAPLWQSTNRWGFYVYNSDKDLTLIQTPITRYHCLESAMLEAGDYVRNHHSEIWSKCNE